MLTWSSDNVVPSVDLKVPKKSRRFKRERKVSVSHIAGNFLEKVSLRDATWFGDSRILFNSSPDS